MTPDNACVLIPGDVRLGTTGAEVGPWIVLAGALVAVGVVLLLVVLLLRRRRGSTSARLIAAALVLGAFVGAGQLTPTRASAADSGCDLLGWSMLTSMTGGMQASLSGTPTEVVGFTLKNVSNVPIEIQLRTDTKADPDGLAPFVELAADCTGCETPRIYLDQMGATGLGTAFRILPGAQVDIAFSARTLPTITNAMQNKSATFGIVALARQV